MSQTVVLKVGMSCQGCVGAVQRVLNKMEGVESFEIKKEEQKVTVKGNVKAEDVFQTVSKTGKKTSFWEPEPEAIKTHPEPQPEPEPEPEPELAPLAAEPTKTTEPVTATNPTTVTTDAQITPPATA